MIATWLVLALGSLAVLAIAGYAVFRTSSRLSHSEDVAVYDLSEAVDWVVAGLSDTAAVRLSRDEISSLLLWQIEALRRRGVASFGMVDEVNSRAVSELEASRRSAVYVTEDDLAVEVLKRAWDEGMSVNEVDVVVALDAHNGYLGAIRAIGSEPPDTPEPPTGA